MAKKPHTPASAHTSPAGQQQAQPQARPSETGVPQLRSGVTATQNQSNRAAMGGAIIDPPKPQDSITSWPFWTGMTLTIVWFAAVFFATMGVNSAGVIAGLPVTTLALGISGVIAPVAFLWMIIAYLQRASDVKAITEPLRRQLQLVLGTGANAEARVRRFNEALERQLELLRQAGDGSYDVLQSAVQVLQEEERAINSLAERSGKEIQRVAGIVRDNSEVLEDLLHDNRERFNDLSGKIAGHIATLDDRADQAAGRLGDMVDRLQMLMEQFKSAAESKLADVANVSEQIGRQERDTEESTRRMNETLQAARLSAQELATTLAKNQDLLDGAGDRLLVRMKDIGAEIERFAAISDTKEAKLAQSGRQLSETMTREIAALEALTIRLEAQIAAANQGIGTRTDELEARQIKLTEQAGDLMQNLQNTVVLLDRTSTEAFEKYSSVRDDVANQSEHVSQQFKISSSHYETMAERLNQISQDVAERIAVIGTNLSGQVEQIASSSDRAANASEHANQNVGQSLRQLDQMIERIFFAEKQANDSTLGLISGMEQKFNSLSSIANQHVARLNVVHDQFEDVGQKLASRAHEAEGTWQSLTQSVSQQHDVLHQQLRARVDEAVALLNENAHAIEAARDSIYQHVEAGLSRTQEMADTLTKVGAMTDAPFNDAVARVRTCVEQGEVQLTHFASVLQKNASDIAELNDRLAVHGDNAGHKAAETLAGLDAVAARMEAIQHGNMQATQDVLLRLNHVAQQVQNRMGDISATAEGEQKRLAETVRQLSLDINGLIHDSQTADQRIRIAASLLSEQASDVRHKLETQARGIEDSLGNLNEQFSVMSQHMRSTTEAAQGHIEQISKRYGEITEMSQSGLNDKIRDLDVLVTGAADRLNNLGQTIEGRTQQLTGVQNQIHDSTQILDNATQQALDRLSVFTHAVVAAKTTSGDTAQEVYARLNDVHEQFNRQIGAVSEGSQTIAQTMRAAVANLVEQSVGLAAASQQAEQRIDSLAATTAALQNEAHKVRMSVEGETAAMQARLADILAQIESASVGMERNAVIAFDRTEGMSKRFDGISQSAFARLGEAAQQIETVADSSIAKVEQVNKSLNEQVLSITFASDHLFEVDSEIRRTAKESTAYLNRISSEVGATASFVAQQLRQQVSGLKHEAEDLLMRFDALGNGLAHQSLGVMDVTDALERKMNSLRDTALAAYEDANSVGMRIINSTLDFRHQVAEAVQTMGAHGDGLQQRGDMTVAMVHQMAGRFAEATQQLRDEFEAQAKRLEDVASGAQQQLQGFTADIKGSVDQLDDLKGKITTTGSDVNETLEKTNFLVRNVGGQIDRMRSSTQEVSNTLLHNMADMIATFENELKGMADNAALNIETLNQKALGISVQIKDDAQIAADTISETLNTMRSNVEESLHGVVNRTSDVMSGVQEQSGKIVNTISQDVENVFVKANQNLSSMRSNVEESLHGVVNRTSDVMSGVQEQSGKIINVISQDVENVFVKANQNLSSMQMDFRSMVVGMVEILVTHLRQVQENGAGVMESIRGGAAMGTEQAVQLLNDLRAKTQAEMNEISAYVEQSLNAMRSTSLKIVDDIKVDSSQTQREAAHAFTVMREQVEAEMREIVSRAQQTAAQLQQNCEQLTDDIRKTSAEAHVNSAHIVQEIGSVVQQAQEAGGAFASVTSAMKQDAANISSSVNDAVRSLSTTNALLQESQDVLYKTAEQLQQNCEQLAKDVRMASEETKMNSTQIVQDISSVVQQAQVASGAFTSVAHTMQDDTAKISAGVDDVTQSLANTNNLLQRSQNTLYDVAQRSSDALGVFNDSIIHQTRSLQGLQQTFLETAGHMSEADKRMHVLKDGFQSVLSEIMDRLNNGLLSLGQGIVNAQQEAKAVAENIAMSTDGVASQSAAMTQTASALAQALAQLEEVNRALSHSMRESAGETAQQARQITTLSQQVQQQVATLENAAQAAAHQSVAVSQALDTPLSRFDALNERMDKTLNLTVMVGDKITGQLGSITREMEHALHDLAEGTHKAGTIIQNTTGIIKNAVIKEARDEAAEDMLQRLRDLTRKSEAQQLMQPASQPLQSFVQPQPVKQAAVAKKQDSDLINSLSQIIQQLEETAGANNAGAALKQKKTL